MTVLHCPDPQRRRLLAAAACTIAAPQAATAQGDFFDRFRHAKLLDQEGRAFRPEILAGRLLLVNFVFTGCSTVCPLQTRALGEMQRQMPPALRASVRLLSVSLDPVQDTPQALKDFALRMGADLRTWTFATGRHDDIERVAEALRLFRPGADLRKPDDHSTALWLVDRRGELRMRYAGNPPDVPRLLRELAALNTLEPARS